MLNSNVSRVSTHWWTNHGDHLCLPMVFCQPHYIASGNLTYSHWKWLFIYIYILYYIYYIIYIWFTSEKWWFSSSLCQRLPEGLFLPSHTKGYRSISSGTATFQSATIFPSSLRQKCGDPMGYRWIDGIPKWIDGHFDTLISLGYSLEWDILMIPRWIDGIPKCPILGIIILGYRWW